MRRRIDSRIRFALICGIDNKNSLHVSFVQGEIYLRAGTSPTRSSTLTPPPVFSSSSQFPDLVFSPDLMIQYTLFRIFHAYTNSRTSSLAQTARECSSPLGEHVLDRLPILWRHHLLDLVLGQPLEVLDAELVALQIGLASHDAGFHEERPLAEELLAGCFRVGFDLGWRDGEGVVADGRVANDPGVHVDTAGLDEHAFRRLGGCSC